MHKQRYCPNAKIGFVFGERIVRKATKSMHKHNSADIMQLLTPVTMLFKHPSCWDVLYDYLNFYFQLHTLHSKVSQHR